MFRLHILFLPVLATLSLVGICVPSPASEERPKAGSAEQDQVPPVKPQEKKSQESEFLEIEAKPFSIKTKLSGVVEAKKVSPVSLDLDRWSGLTVVDVVPHGARVKQGEVLIALETDKLEETIRELEAAAPLRELELKMAEQSLANLEKSTPISLEKANRSRSQAVEDLAYFENVSRPMRERDAKEDVKTAADYLAYAEEELNQLKKMYEQDDLTEETEEIILKRAQNSVDSYRWMLEQTKARSERTLNTDLPREHERLKTGLELEELNWKAGQQALHDELEKVRLDLAGKKRDFEEAERSLLEYRADLKRMEVTAPHDGIVYYGMVQRGKWTTASIVERKLIPGGALSMQEIALTVVDPTEVHVRVSVPEEKLKDLAPEQPATVILNWEGDTEVAGKVESVSHVPFSDNTFDAVVSLAADGFPSPILPGMKAEVEVTVYSDEEAIILPKNAFEKEDGKSYVTVKGGERRLVETGRSSGNQVEVVEGLSVGETIKLPSKEKENPADGGKSEEPAGEKK